MIAYYYFIAQSDHPYQVLGIEANFDGPSLLLLIIFKLYITALLSVSKTKKQF